MPPSSDIDLDLDTFANCVDEDDDGNEDGLVIWLVGGDTDDVEAFRFNTAISAMMEHSLHGGRDSRQRRQRARRRGARPRRRRAGVSAWTTAPPSTWHRSDWCCRVSG